MSEKTEPRSIAMDQADWRRIGDALYQYAENLRNSASTLPNGENKWAIELEATKLAMDARLFQSLNHHLPVVTLTREEWQEAYRRAGIAPPHKPKPKP